MASVIWHRTKYTATTRPTEMGLAVQIYVYKGFAVHYFFLTNVGWSAGGGWKLSRIRGTFKTARTLGFSEGLNSKIREGCPI